MDMVIKATKFNAPAIFLKREMSQIRKQFYTAGDIIISPDEGNYLNRSDQKIMRQDVMGSILIINEMLRENPPKELENIPLYVSNGAFVENTEKHLNRIVNVYKSIEKGSSQEEITRSIYRASPPLIALETLTNSTMSFIAQYTGIKGNNATFGNTSMSSIHALQEASIALQTAPLVIVNSSNCGGDYSYLTNSSVLGYEEKWKDSTGVACLLLGSQQNDNRTSLARITLVKNGFNVPNIESKGIERTWSELMPDFNANVLICSGAYSENENQLDIDYCKKVNTNVYSHFDAYGNMGPSNIFFGIIKAIEFIQEGSAIIDIVDRDVFGRESIIRVEKC